MSSIRPIIGPVDASSPSGGPEFEVCDIDYQEHNIWGATAGMLITLYRRCAGEPSS